MPKFREASISFPYTYRGDSPQAVVLATTEEQKVEGRPQSRAFQVFLVTATSPEQELIRNASSWVLTQIYRLRNCEGELNPEEQTRRLRQAAL